MRIRQLYNLIVLMVLVLAVQAVLPSQVLADYSSQAIVVSTDLLSGSSASSITNFYYNIASLPATSSVRIQFSKDNSSWYSAAGTLDAWTTISATGGADLSLSDFVTAASWTSGNSFYYKLELNATSDLTQTPTLENIRLDYSAAAGYEKTFVFDTSGNVGIGTTSPEYKLDVLATGANIARFAGENNTGCTLSDGGVIACSSDQRLKSNIEDLSFGLNAVMSLRPVSFNWHNETDGSPKSLGFIAQEVEPIIPKLVMTDANGYKELNTIGLIPILAKAVQQQQEEINNIKLSLNDLGLMNATSANDNLSMINDNQNNKLSIIGWIQNALAGLGLAIQDGVASLREIFADRATVKQMNVEQLCITGNDGESVCVDKDQLKELIGQKKTSATIIKTYPDNQISDNEPLVGETLIIDDNSGQNATGTEEN